MKVKLNLLDYFIRNDDDLRIKIYICFFNDVLESAQKIATFPSAKLYIKQNKCFVRPGMYEYLRRFSTYLHITL